MTGDGIDRGGMESFASYSPDFCTSMVGRACLSASYQRHSVQEKVLRQLSYLIVRDLQG